MTKKNTQIIIFLGVFFIIENSFVFPMMKKMLREGCARASNRNKMEKKMSGFNTVTETMNMYMETIPKKTEAKRMVTFGKAIMAGAMIAIGAAASNVASHSISNVSVARMTAGIVFPVGLMMVILLGAELFTGDCMMIAGLIPKKLRLLRCIEFLAEVFIGNFIGGFMIAALTYFSGQFDYSGNLLGAYTIKVALAKATIPFSRGVCSGILCNILVCAAVLLAMCAKDVAGKLLSSFFVIFAFVTSGFEHCVANMYYISAGLLCKCNPEYVNAAILQYQISPEALEQLSVKNFLIGNLLPVTIGNILGGAVFLAIPLLLLSNVLPAKNDRKAKTDSEKQ